ncbi:MAG: hypothetical protein IIC60_11630 [Proteobacteria bacterium]|nr:hypothetical protein [Pseudomonadota bacterium]
MPEPEYGYIAMLERVPQLPTAGIAGILKSLPLIALGQLLYATQLLEGFNLARGDRPGLLVELGT